MTWLDIYRKEFKDILKVRSKRKRTLLLSNLMTQMEHRYQLSMIKETFERETATAVKDLYLEISKARVF